ncbi:hypothetical protein K440DRAFT_642386 [Wilcoxina mikolae CBS 423.85]|nr:hypothetical protein K440DRAFT_642386 [Wilcoxina mikolae CBS 423.85]
MAPLGVITAIVGTDKYPSPGAVRVGGPSWLRNLVGRARETRAAAEVELMSSTSHEVCEIWNGDAIVRVMGSPQIQQFLFFQGLSENVPKDSEVKQGGGVVTTERSPEENNVVTAGEPGDKPEDTEGKSRQKRKDVETKPETFGIFTLEEAKEKKLMKLKPKTCLPPPPITMVGRKAYSVQHYCDTYCRSIRAQMKRTEVPENPRRDLVP